MSVQHDNNDLEQTLRANIEIPTEIPSFIRHSQPQWI